MEEEVMATTTKKPVALKYKVPAKLGEALDLLWKVRAARQEIAAKAEAEKQQEALIENLILDRFGKSELEGATGKLAKASIKRSDVPTVSSPADWKKLEAHIKRTGEFDILQRRLSVEACRARWAEKRAIPGVQVFNKIGLSLTKR
jgi:hypothetical protein